MGHARSGAHSPDCRTSTCAQALAGGGAIGGVLSAQAVKNTIPCLPLRPKRAAPTGGAGVGSRRPPRRPCPNLSLSSKPSPGLLSLHQSGSFLLRPWHLQTCYF